ncbi:MAG TPA: D-alanyl-D-alanine carboxypeptidase [Stellaceae bacterium]|nr:D-alanyl-D-alanine carboxypeptidase [Stellaceae bacterium]
MIGSEPAAARNRYRAAPATPPIFEWILLDAETGQVLSEQNADVPTYPASLTKMMTLYLTFEALNQGKLRLDQPLRVSAEAASRAPSKLGLTPGDTVSVHDLILAVVTRSANDAATVLAEGLAGSEPAFASYMTWKARQLGMQHTSYRNASGLPDPEQRTTARDVARLALLLYHQFPREYRYFATREFEFRGDVVNSHNHLLNWYQGADGIKTGFINASGFNLAASAVRNGHRLIGVIMGGRTWRSRDQQMASLLDQGFAVLAARGPAQPRSAPLVAAAAPPPAAAAPAPVAAVPAVAQPAPASANLASAATPQRSGVLKVANTALRHLTPVAKAEAAPLARETPGAAAWTIQVGAFRNEAAATRAARQVAALTVAKGKPHQVLAPAKSDRSRLYRAQLLHFTEKGAQAACAELRRKRMACSIVPPSALKLAAK